MFIIKYEDEEAQLEPATGQSRGLRGMLEIGRNEGTEDPARPTMGSPQPALELMWVWHSCICYVHKVPETHSPSHSSKLHSRIEPRSISSFRRESKGHRAGKGWACGRSRVWGALGRRFTEGADNSNEQRDVLTPLVVRVLGSCPALSPTREP